MKVSICDRIWRCRDATLAASIAALLVLALPALSVAQSPPASTPTPRPVPVLMPVPEPVPFAIPAPLLQTAPLVPPDRLTVRAPPPHTAPLVPPQTPAVPAPDFGPSTALPVAPLLALILPLESKTYGRAAEAVKAGFSAAADVANAKYIVIPHGDGDVGAAFDKAKAAGATVVIGPLLRDDLKAIASGTQALPRTIALNQLDEGIALPDNVYALPLAVDSEAVQIARRAHADGAHKIVIIGSDAPLQKRFASAFTGEWILLGGGPPTTFRFDRAPDMLALLRKESARATPDTVLLAVNAQDAAIAKPYLGPVTTYTSSQVNDRQPRDALLDLDDVRFVDIPWLADPSAAALARIPRREYPNAALDRLYALGVDAYRVGQAFVERAPDSLEFDGAIGHLTLDSARQFVREGTLLQFRNGEIVPVTTR